MSDIVESHLPCEKCGSSDAAATNSDGFKFCFSCGERWQIAASGVPVQRPKREKQAYPLVQASPNALPARGISREICEKFRYWSDSKHHIACYCAPNGEIVAQKLRDAEKVFYWRGDEKAATLFGRHLWRGQGGRRIVVTEGEIDALSVAEVQGGKWPVVSIKGGALAAADNVAAEIQWLSSFDEVVFLFDADEHGQKAALKCAALLPAGKARVATLPGGALKDANDMLLAGRAQELERAIWEARDVAGEGVLAGSDLVDQLIVAPAEGKPYPWEFVNRTLHGMRPGEIVTWGAGTGIGKSTIVRHIIRHLHERGEKCGVIALEESAQEAALAQVSLSMGKRLHVLSERGETTPDEIKAAASEALRDIWFYDTQSQGVSAAQIVPKLRYMAKAKGVRWVALDHISIVVGGSATQGDERKRIDELMYALRDEALQLGVGLQVVCHLRKALGDSRSHEEGGRVTLDDFRGSGAIKQVSNVVIAVERNQQGHDRDARVATVRVLKNRFTGEAGVLGRLEYVPATGRLEPYTQPEPAADAPKDFGVQEDF